MRQLLAPLLPLVGVVIGYAIGGGFRRTPMPDVGYLPTIANPTAPTTSELVLP